MGQKELLRSKVLEMVKQGQMRLKEGSVMLRVSYRQSKRLCAAYLREGAAGLIHGNYGRRSNNRTDEKALESAVGAYRERYNDFGPTFAAEKLAGVEGIQISASVLGRQLIATGDWQGGQDKARNTGAAGSGVPVLASWYNLTAATTSGLRAAAPPAALSR